jgi:HSP20 family protein
VVRDLPEPSTESCYNGSEEPRLKGQRLKRPAGKLLGLRGWRKGAPQGIKRKPLAKEKSVKQGQRVASQSAEGNGRIEIVSGEGLGEFASNIRDALARRAYELFEARGYEHGNDLEDWFRAESELLHPLKVKVWETDREVVVTAEVPGFRADEMKVGIEPQRVIISGRLESRPPRAGVYPSRAPVALYHTLELPAEVDPPRAVARLVDGLFRLELPKVAR